MSMPVHTVLAQQVAALASFHGWEVWLWAADKCKLAHLSAVGPRAVAPAPGESALLSRLSLWLNFPSQHGHISFSGSL